MKKLLSLSTGAWIIIFSTVLIAAVIWGYFKFKKPDEEVTAKSTRPATEAVATKNIIYAGKTKLNVPVQFSFEIKNTGTKPLVIENIVVDCHCTSPKWDHGLIMPQHTTIVKFTYDGMSLGFYQKKAIVSGNLAKGPILLIMRGEVITDKGESVIN